MIYFINEKKNILFYSDNCFNVFFILLFDILQDEDYDTTSLMNNKKTNFTAPSAFLQETRSDKVFFSFPLFECNYLGKISYNAKLIFICT